MAELKMVPRIREPAWRAFALCGRDDVDAFFPSGRPSNSAKHQCELCPVREECLEYALDSDWEPYGIWGGRTSTEIRPEWARRHREESHHA